MRTLYHVTPEKNVDSIDVNGLSPLFAKVATKRIYLVDYERIPWALIHVSSRDDIPLEKLVVYKCHVHKARLRREPTIGLYSVRSVVVTASYDTFYGWWVHYCDKLGKQAEKIEQAIRRAARVTQVADVNDIPF